MENWQYILKAVSLDIINNKKVKQVKCSMKGLIETFWALLDVIKNKTASSAEKVKVAGGLYLQSLVILVLIGIIFPIPFLIGGVFFDWKWLISLAGIWWAGWTYIILWAAAPIGVFIEGITKGISGSGKRYVGWISSVLTTGLFISLIATYFPIRDNLSLIPPMFLCAFILFVSNGWFFNTKVISSIVSLILVFQTIGAFLPNTSDYIKRTLSFVDMGVGVPHKRNISLFDLQNQKVIVFGPKGEPLFWYLENNGSIELFDNPGKVPTHSGLIELKPINGEAYSKLLSQLEKEDAEKKKAEKLRIEEEELKRQEAELAKKQADEAALAEQNRIAEAQKKQTEIELAKQKELELQKLQDKYFWGFNKNENASQTLAVCCFDKSTGKKSSLTEIVENALRTKNKNNIVGNRFFKDAFYEDGFPNKIFSGDLTFVNSIGLPAGLNRILMCEVFETYANLPELEGMIHADIVVELRLISISNNAIVATEAFKRKGSGGFSINSAQKKSFSSIADNIAKSWASKFNKN